MLLISDLHGQYQALETLLSSLDTSREFLFLGDLNDAKDKHESSTMRCYNLIRQLPNVECLHSNHQEKLLRWLHGKSVKKTPSFRATMREISCLDEDRLAELTDWLESRPLQYEFSLNGTNYFAAHAYYEFSPSSDEDLKFKSIWGKTDTSGNLVPWWFKEKLSPGNVRVSGHYGEMHIREHSIVLDPYNGTGVAALDLVEKKLYLSGRNSLVIKEIN